ADRLSSMTSVIMIHLPISTWSWKYAPEPRPPARLNTYPDILFGRTGTSVLSAEYIRIAYSYSRGAPLPRIYTYPVPSSCGNCSVAGLIHAWTVRQPACVMDSAFEDGTSTYWSKPLKLAARSPFGIVTMLGGRLAGMNGAAGPFAVMSSSVFDEDRKSTRLDSSHVEI